MGNFLLFLLAITSPSLTYTPIELAQPYSQVAQCKAHPGYEQFASLYQIEEMLRDSQTHLSEPVINKVLNALKCALENQVEHNNILTIIDYSLPSNEKRLWVFDLAENQMLFHTYVSHGIKSGSLYTTNFSNKYNSRASSFGVYRTEKPYYGREGLSLRLEGLDRPFNDNAANRAIVMHGGWYVQEPFIQKYGRPGRSWGCPALPLDAYQGVINAIKDDSLMVVYYPDDQWFNRSRFLSCNSSDHIAFENKINTNDPEIRGEVLLGGVNKQFKSESNEAIVAVQALEYEKLFHRNAPLERMLRRQIDKTEYIALSNEEFNRLFVSKDPSLKVDEKEAFKLVNFVIPVIKMNRGYYETHMQLVNFGPIKEIKLASATPKASSYTVYFENKPAVQLNSTDRFIRWLGL